jgi:hypothetical protein
MEETKVVVVEKEEERERGVDDEYSYSESDYYSDEGEFMMNNRNDDGLMIEDDPPPVVERIVPSYPGHCFEEELGMTRSGREATKIFPNPQDLIRKKAAAPNLSTKHLDGSVSSTSEYFQNGKPTVICFYVPWSGPSQLAAVEMEKQYDAYGGSVNLVLINVDYNGTVTERATEVSVAFAKTHKISKIHHVVMDETSKYRLGMYGVSFFPHFVVVSTARTRNQILLNYDDFEWEVVRRLSATTKETVASRSANELSISKEDIYTLSKYLKFGLRKIDIDSYLNGGGAGMSLREFLLCPFKRRR